MVRFILHILFLYFLSVGITACGNTDDISVNGENAPFEVHMTLVVNRGMDSRAVEETEEEGIGYENYIDIDGNDFRFYLFKTDNVLLGEMDVKIITPINSSHTLYFVRAQIAEKPDNSFKVVVAANWGTYPTSLTPGTTTIEDICKASEYHYIRPFEPSATQKIPMYGVHTYENVDFSTGIDVVLGELTLLRAMAKIELICDPEQVGYELVSADLTHFSAYGMGAPIGIYNQTLDIQSQWTSAMHVVPEQVNTGTIPFPIEEENTLRIYVPEYKNTGATYPSVIKVMLKQQGADDSTAKPYPVYLKDYVDGKPDDDAVLDIMRNHCYRFEITKVGAGIDLTYSVAEWIHNSDPNGDYQWNQEFAYPTYGHLVPWSYVTQADPFAKEITQRPTMKYYASNWGDDGNGNQILNDTVGAFRVGFMMTAPAGQKWAPAMHGANTDFIFKVYQNDVEVDINNCVASDQWYQILLIPTDPDNNGEKVQFGISTTLDWAEETLFLLINGQDENTIRWPDSGTDARLIEVLQEKLES